MDTFYAHHADILDPGQQPRVNPSNSALARAC
jgi:hypothetical protein